MKKQYTTILYTNNQIEDIKYFDDDKEKANDYFTKKANELVEKNKQFRITLYNGDEIMERYER